MKKILITFAVCVLVVCGVIGFLASPIYTALKLPDGIYVTHDDIASANANDTFTSAVTLAVPTDLAVSNEEITPTTMSVKFLGITLKKLKVNVINHTSVYVGGSPVGFDLSSDGVIIVGANKIVTANGSISPFLNSGLKTGDCLLQISDRTIHSIDDIDTAVNDRPDPSAPLDITAVRGDQTLSLQITPALDIFSQRYKLGLWVRNSASGIGTLTYVKEHNLRFGAVGHPIVDDSLGENFTVTDGAMYECDLLDIKKGTKKTPGEYIGTIDVHTTPIGTADTNCKYGVYGTVTEAESIDTYLPSHIGGRLSVKPGNAEIMVSLDGSTPQPYSIKIIKAYSQKKADDKSLIFRVTDQRLLSRTGGIVQGMSGSPIMQDGKLIGAVTHVFLNDPTKGYGVYIDWMIDN